MIAHEAGCSFPDAFAGLWFDGIEVSPDEGATWQPLVVDPSFDKPTSMYQAVERPSGGWLGVGGHIESPGINRYTYILRSDDGELDHANASTFLRLSPPT